MQKEEKEVTMKRLSSLALIFTAALYSDTNMPALNPSAGPVVQDWSVFYVTEDVIWWNAQQEGLNFAQSGAAAPGEIQ